MVAGERTLTELLVDWVAARLLMVGAGNVPPPNWPPSRCCLDRLREGRLEDALALPDEPTRYVVTRFLRDDTRHVLLARDVDLDRDIVIKLLRTEDTCARVSATREAKLLARLAHPNVVSVFEVDPEGLYLVLEHLGGDLSDYDDLDRDILLDALCQAGRGLAAVHQRGVEHGDFKLENVFVLPECDPTGRVVRLHAKLGDFGESRVGAGAEVRRRLIGVPEPTGQLPRGADDDQQRFAAAVWKALTAGQLPPAGGELIDAELRAVLERALMADASQRWADLSALVDAIERGRANAAVEFPQNSARSAVLLDWAVTEAKAGAFTAAKQVWQHAERELAGHHRELGEAGLELGVVLGREAARHPGPHPGLSLAVAVLISATRYLYAAGDHSGGEQARRLAALTCEVLAARCPFGSERRRTVGRLGVRLRAMSENPHQQQETREDRR